MSVFSRANFPRLGRIDYGDYWRSRGFEINTHLKGRERIMLGIVPSGARVLDIGCGNSRLPIALKEKGCIVSVGDVSSIVLDGFRKEGIEASVIDLNDIKEVGQHEYIVMSEVLEHMTNPEEIIERLKPHTRYFLVTIPNSAFVRYRLRLFFGGRAAKQWVHHPSEHVRFWSHTDFLEWLSAQGLTVTKAIPSNGLGKGRVLSLLHDFRPNLFALQVVYVCTA